MSTHAAIRRKTVPQIRNSKNKTPVVCLTAYHAHTARLVDPYVDLLLVGDSLGMVMHGMEKHAGRVAGADDPARQGGDARRAAIRRGGGHALRLL